MNIINGTSASKYLDLTKKPDNLLSFTANLFRSSVPEDEIKTKIKADIQNLQFANLHTEGASWIELFAAMNNVALAKELSLVLKDKVSELVGSIVFHSGDTQDAKIWTDFLTRLAEKGSPECKEFAIKASRQFIHALEESARQSGKISPEALPQLKSAMLLLRNYNPHLLPESEQPKFSTLLSQWINFTRSNHLTECLEIQESLEKQDPVPSDTIWDSFTQSQTFYLPLFLPREKAYSQTLIKIEKKENKMSWTDLRDNRAFSTPIISREQLTQILEWNQRCLQESSMFQTEVPPFLAAAMQLPASKTPFRFKREDSFYKPMRIFYSHLDEAGKLALKLQNKIDLLEKVLKVIPQWTDNISLRQWVKGCLINIEHSIDKYSLLPNTTPNAYRLRCQRIHAKIETSEQSPSTRLIPGYSNTAQDVKIELETGEIVPVPKPFKDAAQKIQFQESIAISWPKSPSLKGEGLSEQEYLEEGALLQEWINLAQTAFEAKDFNSLELICSNFFERLPKPDEANPFFDRLERMYHTSEEIEDKEKLQKGQISVLDVKPNQQLQKACKKYKKLFEFEEFCQNQDPARRFYTPHHLVDFWALPLFRMGNFALHGEMVKGGVTPEAFKGILKGLGLSFRLFEISSTLMEQKGVHALSLGRILEGIQNYAADLGEYGGEILELIKSFRVPHTLEGLDGKKYDSEKWDETDPVFSCKDQVAACAAYELLAFLNILCNKQCLVPKFEDENLDPHKPQKNNEALHLLYKGVEGLKPGELIRIDYDNKSGFRTNGYYMFPFGLYFKPTRSSTSSYDIYSSSQEMPNTSFTHLSLPIRNAKIRTFIQQGLVSNRTQFSASGLGVGPSNFYSGEFSCFQTFESFEAVEDVASFEPNTLLGHNQNQLTILREQEGLPGVSNQCFVDLQLMQTSTLSRAENTLYTFLKYPELLSQLEHGADWRTIFSLNLFRDAALYREFQHHPEKIEAHFQKIDQLIHHYQKAENLEVFLYLIDVRMKMIKLLTSTIQQNAWDEKLLSKLSQSQDRFAEILQNRWTELDLFDKNQKGAIARALLLHHLHQNSAFRTEDEIFYLAKLVTMFFLTDIVNETPDYLRNKIKHYLQNYLPAIWSLVKNLGGPKQILDLAFEEKQSANWQQVDRSTWRKGAIVFDLSNFEMRVDNQLETFLPPAVRKNTKLCLLAPQKILSRKILFKTVQLNNTLGWGFSFESRGYTFEVYFDPKQVDNLLIYRRKDENLEQLVDIKFGNRKPYQDDLFCWKTVSETYRIENAEGMEVYRHEGEKLIVVSKDGDHYEVLGHQKLGENRKLFNKLCGENAFELIKSASGKTHLHFSRYGYRYLWDVNKRKWHAESFPGYYLSNLSTEACVYVTTTEQGKTPLFKRSFDGYHILEKWGDPDAPKKLIVAPAQYVGTSLTDVQKYQFEPEIGSEFLANVKSLCHFEINADGQLISKNPQDYLYLSYLLLSQKKYSDALHYLKLGCSVADYDPLVWASLSRWIVDLPDDSPDGLATKIAILLSEQEVRQYRKETIQETLQLDQTLPSLMKLVSKYHPISGRVTPHLRVNPNRLHMIGTLELRALQRDEQGIIKNPDWKVLYDETEKHLGKNTSAEEMLKITTTLEVDFYRKRVSGLKEQPTTLAQASLTDIDELDLSSYLIQRERSSQKIHETIQELIGLFDEDSYADEIGQALIADITYAVKQHHLCLAPVANAEAMEELKDKCTKISEKWADKEKGLKQQICSIFRLPRLKQSELRQQALQEQSVTLEELLDEARICYLNNDWTSLIKKEVISENDALYLDDLYKAYLSSRTTRKHWKRKSDAIQKYLSKELHEYKLIEILKLQRSYSDDGSSLSRIFAVVEDTLDITIREMQLSSLMQQIEYFGAFKHAGTGFGKTSLQRHLILRIKSLQNMLAAGLTHSDLFQTHHKALANTQSRAFSVQTFPFNFSRQDKLDLYQLQQLERQFLRGLLEHGCFDHRKNDILSFKHSFTTELLNHGDAETLQQFQRVRQLLKTKAAVNSDELVTVLNPNQDHTFAYGNVSYLDEAHYTSCLEIFTLIKDDPEFKKLFDYIRQNKLRHLSDREFSSWIDKIATKLISKIEIDNGEGVGLEEQKLDQEKALGYLTQKYLEKEHAESILSYYKDVISKLKNKKAQNQLYCYHRYLEIFKNFRSKMVGVNFGRSKDGMTTKPYQKSARPMESSQRSDVPTTIFETCFDYCVNGIASDKVLVYIDVKRAQAIQEVDLAEKRGTQISQTETSTAKNFKQAYEISLFSSSINAQELKQKIESSGKNLSDYLIHTYFKQYTYYPSKIIGNSSHIPNQYKEISGSSGSAERVETLPSAIKRHKELLRQKGDVGTVFYRLIENFEEKNYLKIDPFKPVAAQIGPHLKQGDVFIDAVPFFPGQTAQTIAEELRTHSAHTTQNMRFLDEDGYLRSLKPEEIDPKTTGVLSQIHVEGTDWKFEDGIISFSSEMDLTGFYQAIRMRDLGKGQNAHLASDVNWNEIEAKYPKLKNKSLIAKIIYLIVVNDTEISKKLIYARLLKEVPAIAENALDNFLDLVKDVDSLNQIKQLTEVSRYLVSNNAVKIESLGAPRMPIAPTQYLQDLADQHIKRLQDILNEIEAKKIKCNTTQLKQAIVHLKNLDQILPDSNKMPKHAFLPNCDLDGVEDLEVVTEIDEVGLQEVSLEVDIGLTTTVAIEQNILSRKNSKEGQEVTYSPFKEAIYALLSLPLDKKPNSFQLNFAPVDTLYITSHVGGHPTGQTFVGDPTTFFWFGGANTRPAMSPKVTFVEHGDKRIPVVMSLKDGDLFLQPSTLKLGLKRVRENEHTYIKPDPNEDSCSLKVHDLRDQHFPDWAKEGEKMQIVLAKLMYLDCPFSDEELALARKLIKDLDLENKLQAYLKTNFPQTWNLHPLTNM